MTRYYLASGQSNMVGRGSGGPTTFSPLLKVWNNQNDLSDLTNLGTAWVDPELSQRPFVNGKNNLAVHAANHIALTTGDDVRLIIVAKGDTSISEWFSASVRKAMLNRITAVLSAAGVTALDGFWWHQGEADDTTSRAGYYPGRWAAMISALTTDGNLTSTTPIVMGEVSPNYTIIPPVLQGIADADSRIRQAPNRLFETYDGIHFTGSELARIGLVYAGLQMLLEA
jgi:hypothetical protein